MQADERLVAYVDGELAPAEREAFERELADEPELQRAVEQHRALLGRLSRTYAPVLEEPTPLRLTLAAQTANTSSRRWGVPQWAAMAACLAVGVLVGRALLPSGGPIAAANGELVARGGLEKALTNQLAADAGPIRVGLSFRSGGGRYCRTFQSAPDRLAGVACREEHGWTARAVTAWAPPAGPAYRTAGSETPAPVLAAVDELIAGAPLDATAERTARDKGWR